MPSFINTKAHLVHRPSRDVCSYRAYNLVKHCYGANLIPQLGEWRTTRRRLRLMGLSKVSYDLRSSLAAMARDLRSEGIRHG